MESSSESTTGRPVVVGITGPGREQAAIRFAMEQARRLGSEVLLAHAVHPTGPLPLTAGDVAEVGSRVTEEVGEEVGRTTDGSVPFRALAVRGTPARVLGDLGREAAMVVLERHHGRGLGRLLTGSTATAVAARTDCPVVSVGRDWQSDDVPLEVVVGVHEDGGPLEALEAAFTWAEQTGRPLRVVHAWRLDGLYDDLVTGRVAQEWRERQQQFLTDTVADLRDAHPDVPVTLEVRHQWPSDTLVDDSRAASLLVIGRHGTRPWATQVLGSVARTVLREARCPVMVVPVGST